MVHYVMGEITLTETAWVRRYLQEINLFIEKHGGCVLARSVNTEKIEGDRRLPTNVILVEFPTREAAAAFFDDPEYQPLRALRRAGSHSEFIAFPAEDLAVMPATV